MIPQEIKRQSDGIHITWDSNNKKFLTSKTLREHCPCATCKFERGDTSHEAPLTSKKKTLKIIEATKDESLTITSIEGMGNYAVKIFYGDGHDTGIYTFDFLFSLSESI